MHPNIITVILYIYINTLNISVLNFLTQHSSYECVVQSWSASHWNTNASTTVKVSENVFILHHVAHVFDTYNMGPIMSRLPAGLTVCLQSLSLCLIVSSIDVHVITEAQPMKSMLWSQLCLPLSIERDKRLSWILNGNYDPVISSGNFVKRLLLAAFCHLVKQITEICVGVLGSYNINVFLYNYSYTACIKPTFQNRKLNQLWWDW